jgi:hypothetical protein
MLGNVRLDKRLWFELNNRKATTQKLHHCIICLLMFCLLDERWQGSAVWPLIQWA